MKRSRLRAISAKRAAERPLRAVVVAATLDRAGNRCEAEKVWPEVACGGPLDAHEVKTRGRGGSELDLANTKCVCRRHHDALHASPGLALERGLLASSWED